MVYNPLLVAALSAGLLAPLASGMYAKNSPVIQLDAKSFNQKIIKSGHASIVEFYAPWCGHCKSLKPAYEAAATNLKGLANVAAIDCDDDKNKPTCGEWGIKGFPTLKSFKPGKNGKPVVEDYNGPRTAKGVVDWTLDRIPNHVARVSSKTVEEFLSKDNQTAKAILFTTKGVATPLYKALAIDFHGAISFAQVRDKETEATALFGVEKFPTMILLPGGSAEGVVYDGEMKKEAMHKFLSGFAEPTEGKGAPKEAKKEKKEKKETKEKKDTKENKETKDTKEDSSSSSSTSSTPPRPTFDSRIPESPPMETIVKDCAKKTCILIITPPETKSPLTPFEKTNAYLNQVKPNMFPFFQLPRAELVPEFKSALEIDEDEVIQMRALNVKKGWWVAYHGKPDNHEEMESWADALRMGELTKRQLPKVEPPSQEQAAEPPTEGEPSKEDSPKEEVPKEETPKEEEPAEPVKEAPKHDEL